MMKRAIFICNYFAPENKIAAIRTTNLAAALRDAGYEVTFLAEECNDAVIDETLAEYAKGIKVIRTGSSKLCKDIMNAYKKVISPFKNLAMGDLDNRIRPNKQGVMEFHTYEMLHPVMSAMDMVFTSLLRQYDVYRRSKKVADNLRDYDVIISSFGSFYPIFLGYYMKRKHPDIPWVVDIRDTIYHHKFTSRYMRWYSYEIEKTIAKYADRIVVISKGIQTGIKKRRGKDSIYIPNGFNKNDRRGMMQILRKDKMTFSFTGSLYGGCIDISPAFSAIRELIEDGLIDINKVSLTFAGGESVYGVFKGLAERYGLRDCCVYLGYLTRKETLKAQMSAHILLVGAYDDNEHNYGCITGKIYEYMSAKRPVIAMVTGGIDKSELVEIVRNTNIGIAYEDAHKNEDENRLKTYIKERYEEFINGETLTYKPNTKEVQKYNYEKIGKDFVSVVDGVIGHE